jgi:hypothetical protein
MRFNQAFTCIVLTGLLLSCKAMQPESHSGRRSPGIASSTVPVYEGGRTGSGYSTGDQSPYPSTTPSSGLQGSMTPSPTPSMTGTGSPTPDPSASPSDTVVIDAGVHRYLSTGTMTSRAGTTQIRQDLDAHLTSDRVNFELKAFRATGGDRKERVDEEISSKIGLLSYVRSSSRRLDEQSNAKYRILREFMVFADRSEDRTGLEPNDPTKTVVYVAPVPVLVAPAPLSRYSALTTTPITLRSSAQIGGRTIALDLSVRRGAQTGNNLVIIVDLGIATDEDGELFEVIPIPKRTEFTIDTSARRVLSIKSISEYNDDNKRYNITVNHVLCSITRNGNVENFGTCRNP